VSTTSLFLTAPVEWFVYEKNHVLTPLSLSLAMFCPNNEHTGDFSSLLMLGTGAQ